jgi:hypothetical protein
MYNNRLATLATIVPEEDGSNSDTRMILEEMCIEPVVAQYDAIPEEAYVIADDLGPFC